LNDTIVNSAPPAWQNPADSVLVFNQEFIHFDTVVEGELLRYQFAFSNLNSKQPLEIDIVSACDCIATEWTTDPVQPGFMGFVEITLDTKAMRGPISKDVDVVFKNTDGKGYPLVKQLKVKAVVQRRR
jgi:Protein of unknown function (DUF1573)